jgi:hypothetical protein
MSAICSAFGMSCTAVSATMTVRPAQRDGHADHPMAGLGIDNAAHILQHCRIVAGHARDHGVGIAQRHHRRGEMVAVVVDQALAVAEEEALALHLLVEMVGIDRVAAREARIDDLDAVAVQLDAGIAGGLAHDLLAADQNGGAEALIHEGDGGAHDLLLLALGEDDALRLAAHAVIDALEGRSDRIAAGGQFLRIFLPDRRSAAGDAGSIAAFATATGSPKSGAGRTARG